MDYSENTGGFLVLISEQSDFSNGFDCWVESLDALQSYFLQSQWIVKRRHMQGNSIYHEKLAANRKSFLSDMP
ncbi:hypothetical protein SOASR030_03540 [Leminorella grimontii]|uniref:Uncharacterized protein n=1 Tax=Leminorella grimontii TaxID=82981 RepID=A0AAV5N1B8_9GAMM|nr:hypothetical protein SOASR030_03540 [Leminorella grimontii]GKX60518.1 hypothetical protein SOASR031_28330 [Leminorella grimontii]